MAPPDAVAAAAVLKQVKLPKRIVTVLEGESLINDASSLVLYMLYVAERTVDLLLFQVEFLAKRSVRFSINLVGVLH